MPALLHHTDSHSAGFSDQCEDNGAAGSNPDAFNPSDVFVWEAAGDMMMDEQVLHLGTADHLEIAVGCEAGSADGVDCLPLLDK